MALRDMLTDNLDNLRFQKDLVDEARKRIVRYCPEWTEYNVSDPGITLIELFAWMTEQIVYRLNLVPRKNYIKFLDMLGVQLEPPVAASTELTFYLSTPFPLRPTDPPSATKAKIKKGLQVSTTTPTDGDQITFTTVEELTIVTPKITELRRGEGKEFASINYCDQTAENIQLKIFEKDATSTEKWAYLYIGFSPEYNVAGHIIQLDFKCTKAEGSGGQRNNPAWQWEACLGKTQNGIDQFALHKDSFNNVWQRLTLGETAEEKDTTGGFNNPEGHLSLYLPLEMQPVPLQGNLTAYWVRCVFTLDPTGQNGYSNSPIIEHIMAKVLGATVKAQNAVEVQNELLGVSTGDADQTFTVKQSPLLTASDADDLLLEVEELHDEQGQRQPEALFVRWEKVSDFSNSTPHDRHYTLDPATGEVHFGPAVRQRDGAVRQYGRIPSPGMYIRMTKYRYSGGARGNLPVNQLKVMNENIAYIDRVTNRERVTSGRDQETLEEAVLRAQREMHAQKRAVTAADYELFAKKDDRRIARVKCLGPLSEHETTNHPPDAASIQPGELRLLVVPAAYEALQQNDYTQLRLNPALERAIRQRLETYRLLTTSVKISAPAYIGVRVSAQIVPDARSDRQAVEAAVKQMLQDYITPLRLAELAPLAAESSSSLEKVAIVIDSKSNPDAIRLQVEDALRQINGKSGEGQAEDASGVTLDRETPTWDGWEFGAPLHVADLYARIQQVKGVKHVLQVKLEQKPVNPAQQATTATEAAQEKTAVANPTQPPESPRNGGEWQPVPENKLGIPRDALLCSPEPHQIELKDL